MVEEYYGKGEKLYAAFMDLEKAYDRVDREAFWNVLRIYGAGGQLLGKVRVEGDFPESFPVEMGVRQGCVMAPWLFNIFMDGCMKDMKVKVGNVGARLKMDGGGWAVVAVCR